MKPSLRTLGLFTAALLAYGAAGLAVADSDDDDDDDNVAPVTNATYAEECGACHMAYQPGLLPAAAWQQIMRTDALADHYGDDASLADDVSADITAYLSVNSSGKASPLAGLCGGRAGSVTCRASPRRVTSSTSMTRSRRVWSRATRRSAVSATAMPPPGRRRGCLRRGAGLHPRFRSLGGLSRRRIDRERLRTRLTKLRLCAFV